VGAASPPWGRLGEASLAHAVASVGFEEAAALQAALAWGLGGHTVACDAVRKSCRRDRRMGCIIMVDVGWGGEGDVQQFLVVSRCSRPGSWRAPKAGATHSPPKHSSPLNTKQQPPALPSVRMFHPRCGRCVQSHPLRGVTCCCSTASCWPRETLEATRREDCSISSTRRDP
jgi:hypothetical protein